MSIGIYRIVNTTTDRTYLGSSVTVEARLKGHRRSLQRNDHGNRHLQFSWNKHGESSFVFEPLLECDVDHLTAKEQSFIDAYREHDLSLFNLVPSADSRIGFRDYKPTAEALAKMSAANKGKMVSLATRAKLSIAGRGRARSVELRARIRAALLGRKISAEHRENIRLGYKPRVVSAETRKKLSAWQKGKKYSETRNAPYIPPMKGRKHSLETRTKMSSSHMGHAVSDETRRKLSEAKKRWYAQINHFVESQEV